MRVVSFWPAYSKVMNWSSTVPEMETVGSPTFAMAPGVSEGVGAAGGSRLGTDASKTCLAVRYCFVSKGDSVMPVHV